MEFGIWGWVGWGPRLAFVHISFGTLGPQTPLFISTPSCLSSQTYQNQGATSLCMLRQAIGGEEKQERYMKLNSAAMAADQSNKRSNRVSCRRLGGYLRQQKGRLYIIRRCVVMLLCWHD
ncbi:unnamed protein product [Prunus armeniaca]|nr:hypothetical protein GBA52_011701 [Prunus armeniaca]